jgi:hypothetical protein
MLSRRTCLMLLAFQSVACNAAEPMAMATVVDGNVVLVRQTTRLVLKPGVRLAEFDLIETAVDSVVARVEYPDGSAVDIGPDSRVMMSPILTSGGKYRASRLYVLNGWVKFIGVPASDITKSQVMAESFDLSGVSGSAVLSIQSTVNQVFAESGSVNVRYRSGKSMQAATLKPGGFMSIFGSEKYRIDERPGAVFVAAVPRAFLDPIPLRFAVFKDRPDPPSKALGDLGYAQAAPWLGAELAVRRLLVDLWRAKLNADLRNGLATNIKKHPEWRSILFPDSLPLAAPSRPGAVQ